MNSGKGFSGYSVKLKTRSVLHYCHGIDAISSNVRFCPALYYTYSYSAHLELGSVMRKGRRPFDGKTCNGKYMPEKQILKVIVDTGNIDYNFLSIMG